MSKSAFSPYNNEMLLGERGGGVGGLKVGDMFLLIEKGNENQMNTQAMGECGKYLS